MVNPRQRRDDQDDSDDLKQDPKFGDDTEYQFSEDEFTYQVEKDMKSQKKSSGSFPLGDRIQALKERFGDIKMNRLVWGGVGFLIFIGVVYKMISPSSSTETPVVALQAAAPVTSARPAQSPGMLSQPAVVQQPVQQQPVQQAQASAPPIPIVNAPPVVPVQGAPVSVPSGVVPASQVENKLSQVNQSNEALLNQMQAEYLQRLNDYAAQNKSLTEEVKTLTNRVATLESELNQLLQALMKTNIATQVAGPLPQDAQDLSASVSQAKEVKLPYSVQAIIPGRAWLRSETGETVTVGEGDSLKEGGKVSKIDPYDGVVEVTIGKKTVALSYGNNDQ